MLRELVEEDNDLTLEELAQWLHRTVVKLVVSTVHKALVKLGIIQKWDLHATKRARGDVRRLRWPFRGERFDSLAPRIGRRGLVAPLILRGSKTGAAFEAYVEQFVVPARRPGDIVIWGNLGVHKSATYCSLVEQAGARVVFLPPYSPDLNPIEMAWSKVMTLLRCHAARTWERWSRPSARRCQQSPPATSPGGSSGAGTTNCMEKRSKANADRLARK